MKSKVTYIWIFGIIFASGLLFSGIYAHRMPKETEEIVSFVTIGVDQTNLSPDRALHEIQMAEEHFSDLVLGWSVAPDFVTEMNDNYGVVPYSGRRQEKQNLIFTYETSDMTYAEAFIDALESRINEYNDATYSTFRIARESHTLVTQEHHRLRVFFGINLLVGIFLLIGLFAFDYSYAHRRRS